MAFSRRVLEARLRRPIGPIFEISALRQLQNPGEEAGWHALQDCLAQLAAGSGAGLAEDAAWRGAARLQRQLLHAIRQESKALQLPVREAGERGAELSRTHAAARRSQGDLDALMGMEQQQLGRQLAQRRTEFLRSVRAPAQADLRRRLAALPRRGGPAFRRAAMAAAQASAQQRMLPWLEQQQIESEAAFRAAWERFVSMSEEFLQRHPELVPQGVAVPAAALNESSSFRFADFIARADPASPLRHAADVFLSALHWWRPIEDDALRFLDLLLDTNAQRVQSDLEQRIAISRQRLQRDLARLLADFTAAAGRACERARMAQEQGSATVAQRQKFLVHMEAELAACAPAPSRAGGGSDYVDARHS
ncbi:MAG: hypothetical protein ACRD04_05030 [Terriglobales bacterium]